MSRVSGAAPGGFPGALEPRSATGAQTRGGARVIQLRKQTDSADDIQQRVRVDGLGLSVTMLDPSLREQGVAKLPRRRDGARALTGLPERAEPTPIAAIAWNPWRSVETAAGGGLVVVPL